MLNAGIFILVYSTKNMLYDGDLLIMKILCIAETGF